MDEPGRLTTHRFAMLDTGIGRELGYVSDKEFIAAIEEQRARLDPGTRQLIADIEALEADAFLFGIEHAERELGHRIRGR